MIANVFSRAKALKIQNQLLLLLVLSTVIPVAVVGLYGTFAFSKAGSNFALDELQEEATSKAEIIDSFLDNAAEDVLFLSKSTPMQGLIRARNSGGNDEELGLEITQWTSELSANITALMSAKTEYQSFRYIDENGNEILRVDRNNQDRDQITTIPTAELQNIAERPYFQTGLELAPGQVLVSEVSLQRKQGEVIEPYQPLIHYIIPIFDDRDFRQGMLVGSIFADQFLNLVNETDETEASQPENKTIKIVNADGYYLLHTAEPDKAWGFDLGFEETLQNDYSAEVMETLWSGQEADIVESGRQLLSYARVDPSPDRPGRHFYVLEAVSKNEVYGAVTVFKFVTALVILVALAVVLPLGTLRGRQLVGLITRLINSISSSSQQISSTVTEQEQIANQQAASVNETTTTMEELKAASLQSAAQATDAVQTAKLTLEQAEVGSNAVGETLEGMFDLEQKVEAIADQTIHLSSRASQIGGISAMVSEFASQTHMLALNSSMEAVRAGEYGKGFAVVANEIRKLSDRSEESAAKINALVAEIQKLINQTVMMTEEGTKTVKTGVQIAKRTEESFSEVKQGIDSMVINNQQVALTQKQQVDAILQVVDAMISVDRGSQESAIGLSQTRLATQQLSQEALSLKEMV
ncbi:MAG: methyl-accepting chemotaxis protein [Cyanobacteria bacterium P01_D01_bin.44]